MLFLRSFFLAMVLSLAAGCSSLFIPMELEIVSSSHRQWTGVAVSSDGRIFVNYPYWSDDVPVSVAEIVDGDPVPYPSEEWNKRGEKESFFAVQSVHVDAKNRLWVLDTNNKKFTGVNENGPCLYSFDLKTNKLIKSYRFPDCYKKNSYFNDISVDPDLDYAYITDSGDGAIIVLDIKTGNARRLLENHPSVKHETDKLLCDGHLWANKVDSDGIALSPDRRYLYYIALSGHTLYRIKTEALRNDKLSEKDLGAKVERIMKVPATDGMIFDKNANLYMGGLENNSVNVVKPDGKIYRVITAPQIAWADSFAFDPKGEYLYFTSSQIHLPPESRGPYRLLRLDLQDAGEVLLESGPKK